MAYVLKKEDLERAVVVLERALEAYNARKYTHPINEVPKVKFLLAHLFYNCHTPHVAQQHQI
jgi:hypothetical protein